MTKLRMDHIVVVVEDIEAATAFFTELGLEVEGGMPIQGDWVDRVNGIEGIDVEILMLRTPDGSGKLELTVFRNPPLIHREPAVEPPNTQGYRSVMFEVDNVDEMVDRLRPHGGELIGEITDYEPFYRLCYLRGPGGIIVALAQSLS